MQAEKDIETTTITVTITTEDFATSRYISHECALWKAVSRLYPNAKVIARGTFVEIDDVKWNFELINYNGSMDEIGRRCGKSDQEPLEITLIQQ